MRASVPNRAKVVEYKQNGAWLLTNGGRASLRFRSVCEEDLDDVLKTSTGAIDFYENRRPTELQL